MIRQSLEELLVSSTTVQVERFLRETKLSESLPNLVNSGPIAHNSPDFHSNLLNMASTPQLDVEVAADSLELIDHNANNNNTYKKMLKYKPNANFHGELSSINGVSVPNTFKHKSHPNARTKERIGLSITSEEHIPMEDISAQPVKTSTIKGVSISNDNSHEEGHTPSWMPPELEQKWDEGSDDLWHNQQSSGSVRIRQSKSGDMVLDFLNSESNTFVHNVPTSDQAPASTPIWKRMSHEYQAKAKRPLQSIFQSADDSSEKEANKDPARHTSKNGHSPLMLFSTASTPVATRESDMHLTQHQIHQLEDMLEKAKDKPDDYQIKGSPLKLFGSEYDTFTKAILTKFVEKVRSNASSIQREQHPVQIQLSAPKLNIKNFTKFGDYTDQDFKKNANDLFANIQKKAHNGSNIFNKPSNESLSLHKSLTQSHTTATSTPKSRKTHDLVEIVSIDEYSPYSTDFDENSSVAEYNVGEKHESTMPDRDEYTSIEKTFLSKEKPNAEEEAEDRDDNASSYTFDDLTDFDETDRDAPSLKMSPESAEKRSYSAAPMPDGSPLSGNLPDQFESSMPSVKQYWSRRKPSTLSDKGTFDKGTFESFDMSEFDHNNQRIKWKRASQLRLLKSSPGTRVMRNSSTTNVVKGTVKPGNYPDKYGNMVFDFQNNKWVSDDKENDFPGSLDSIEDLLSDSGEQNTRSSKQRREASILKLKDRPSRDKNLEVSFQVPDSIAESVDHKGNYNVTNVSELGNVTFTQTNKKLISLITGSTDESSWERVTFIDLSSKNLERVEGLEDYLPSIKKMSLANNHLEFIEGLPQGLLELNIAHNKVGNITSFKKFRDLLILEAPFNSLKSLSGLSYNLHLTRLDLSTNKVKSLNGLELMHSLMSLDLSGNDLLGHINFNNYNFSALQILNLSENKIQTVSGLECVPKLRVLNLRDNELGSVSCLQRHVHLKKFVLKFNKLTQLNLEQFPFLRILRIDGNSLNSISGLSKLKFLQELSAKCQDDPIITKQIILEARDVVNLDLSGNYVFASLFSEPSLVNVFANLNLLNLSAVGLTSLPESFGKVFENVRELNINFNKLTNLEGLTNLCRLKRVNAVSNNMSKMEMVLSSLRNSRKTLKLLDLRLNVFNFELYPYVFNPHELEIAAGSGIKNFDSSPIPLEAYDDIENFSIHYNTLVKSRDEWEDRDTDFFEKMRAEGNYKRVNERLNYETILVKFFPKLRDLDGSLISLERRVQIESRIHLEVTE